MTRVLNFLSIVLSWLVAGASVCSLALWPHWWLVGAVGLFIVTLVSFGFLMAASYSLKHYAPMPPHLEAFCKAYLLLIGYPLDYLLNAAVFTVLLLWPPLETTTTERLQKHVKRGGWFGLVARYFAGVWVNPLELVNRPHVPLDGDR